MTEMLSADNTACDTEAQCQLDESELHDYVKNEGQWPSTLVSENKISLADVLNPKVEVAAPAKGAKPAGKVAAQSDVVMDEADLEVADAPANNFVFGDVIDQLIKLHFPSRHKAPSHPQLGCPQGLPRWVPILGQEDPSKTHQGKVRPRRLRHGGTYPRGHRVQPRERAPQLPLSTYR
jgi:hypothetical protein